MGLFSSAVDARNALALARIEKKLDALMLALGVEAPGANTEKRMDDILALARSGQKIQAIKLYRQRTGAGLSEAKAAVDAMG